MHNFIENEFLEAEDSNVKQKEIKTKSWGCNKIGDQIYLVSCQSTFHCKDMLLCIFRVPEINQMDKTF